MNIANEITPIIKLLENFIDIMKKKRLAKADVQDVQTSINEINTFLYHSEKLKFQKNYNLEDEKDYIAYIKEMEKIITIWKTTLQRRTGKTVDVEFWDIYEYFKYVDAEQIYQTVVKHLLSLPEDLRIEYLSLPKRYTFLKGKIDFIREDFSLIREYVEMMAHNVERYKKLYERLADYRSKMVLNGIIRYWFNFNIAQMHTLSETVFKDYYDLDILECDENEVLVDLGAYTGDSVIDFINTYGTYKKIYAYELTPSTYITMTNNLASYPNIIPIQKGVGSKSGTMYVNDKLNGAGNKILESGDTEVEIVTLDEDITEPITTIKMDVEGAEKDAILGAAHHIKHDKPKMLISAYHLSGDIFDIPDIIDDIRDDYKYYLRFNGRGIWPCDYVLFAI